MNNREYTSDAEYQTDELARDAAATRAYLICRHFSVNDGMIPGQRQGQGGVVQGLPVAIGTGRRRIAGNRSSGSNLSGSDQGSGNSSGSDSGRSSSSSRIGHRLSDGDSSITSVDASISSIASKTIDGLGIVGRNKSDKPRAINRHEHHKRTSRESSGGSSPVSSDTSFDIDTSRAVRSPRINKITGINMTANMGPNAKMRSGIRMPMGDICYCGQPIPQLYGRCGNCLR